MAGLQQSAASRLASLDILGMKVAAMPAIAGAVVGESIGSEHGLGFLMVQVQTSLDTPAMFMAVLLLTLLGLAITIGLERLCVVKDARLQSVVMLFWSADDAA